MVCHYNWKMDRNFGLWDSNMPLLEAEYMYYLCAKFKLNRSRRFCVIEEQMQRQALVHLKILL